MCFFFFNDTATTEIYTLSLHDALPISDSLISILILRALALHAQGEQDRAFDALEQALVLAAPEGYVRVFVDEGAPMAALLDRKSTRLNSSHANISYAVFCLKKKT